MPRVQTTMSAKVSLAMALGLALAGCQHVAPHGQTVQQPLVPELDTRASAGVARAQRALADGRLGAARDGFAAALRADPGDVTAGLGLAETYLALNDFTTAGRIFEATARHASGRARARVLQGRGLIALHRERLSEARRALRAAVDLDDKLWRSWVGLGRLHARAGEANAARVAFAQAEASAPVLGTVMNDIGMSYLSERQPDAAVKYFERALVAEPGLDVARGNLRIARAMTGDYDMAISGTLPEDLPDTLNNVGYIAVINGDFDVADRLLRRALEISPTYHEAAVANLDLLAHAKLSGQRPSEKQALAAASDRQVPREGEGTAVASAETAARPAASAALREAALVEPASMDRVALAATREGPVPDHTGDIGFRWEKSPDEPRTVELPFVQKPAAAPQTSSATDGSAPAREADEQVALSAARPASPAVPDREELGDFRWQAAALAQGGKTTAGGPPEAETERLSERAERISKPLTVQVEAGLVVSEPATEEPVFTWSHSPATVSAEPPPPVEAQGEGDGFIWGD